MITPGTEVKTTCRIMDDGCNINAGAIGKVLYIDKDMLTDKPWFIVQFNDNCIMGCFLNEVEAVEPIVKGEWV